MRNVSEWREDDDRYVLIDIHKPERSKLSEAKQ